MSAVNKKAKHLTGLSLLLGVSIGYLAPIPANIRDSLLKQWKSWLTEYNLFEDDIDNQDKYYRQVKIFICFIGP